MKTETIESTIQYLKNEFARLDTLEQRELELSEKAKTNHERKEEKRCILYYDIYRNQKIQTIHIYAFITNQTFINACHELYQSITH